jgi:hypothetical protein
MKATPGIAVVARCVLVGVGVASSLEAEAEGVFVSSPAREVTLKSGKRLHCATGRTTPVYPTPP